MTRTDSASRVVHADVQRVFAALVDEAALRVWLLPHGMTGRFEHFDLRPGGSYRLVLTYTDASAGAGKTTSQSDIVEVRFVEIVPDARVVQAVDFVSDELATWLGWAGVGWGLAFGAGLVATRFAGPFNPPFWAHLYTGTVGVYLLLR